MFLCTDPERTDTVFKCDYCVVEQKLLYKHLIPLSQIRDSEFKTVFWQWPFPNDLDLIERVRTLSLRPKRDESFKLEIDSFFKQLRIEVLAKIEEVQESMNKKA